MGYIQGYILDSFVPILVSNSGKVYELPRLAANETDSVTWHVDVLVRGLIRDTFFIFRTILFSRTVMIPKSCNIINKEEAAISGYVLFERFVLIYLEGQTLSEFNTMTI